MIPIPQPINCWVAFCFLFYYHVSHFHKHFFKLIHGLPKFLSSLCNPLYLSEHRSTCASKLSFSKSDIYFHLPWENIWILLRIIMCLYFLFFICACFLASAIFMFVLGALKNCMFINSGIFFILENTGFKSIVLSKFGLSRY